MTSVTVEETCIQEPRPASVMPATKQHVDALIDFIGGVAGGTASVYVGQPLDTVKVKMQTFPAMYRNAGQCFTKTLREEGISRGLYAGTVPSLAAQVSENAILFMAYGMCQKAVAAVAGVPSTSELSVIQSAVAGSCAAFFSSFTLCPTELIKCKMQAMEQMRKSGQLEATGHGMATSQHVGPLSLTRQILREEGLRGIFRGLVPTFCREMPGYFFFFGGYELSRTLLTPVGKSKDDLGSWQTVVCGAMGGVSLWLAVFPTDVVKSRIQVQVGQLSQSPLTVAVNIAHNEGIRALYKGLGPTLLRTAPATGALFLAYETVKKALYRLAYESDADS